MSRFFNTIKSNLIAYTISFGVISVAMSPIVLLYKSMNYEVSRNSTGIKTKI